MRVVIPNGLAMLFLAATLSAAAPLSFTVGGRTNYGNWSADVRVSAAAWRPGDTVAVDTTLHVTAQHIQNLAAAGIKADSFLLLVTAERSFDSEGHLRLLTDQYMSTLVTPTGLPIEGGPQAAATTRFGGPYKSPLDEFVKQPIAVAALVPGDSRVVFHTSSKLPADLPPGIYRLRMDFGVARGSSNYSLNGDGFASQAFFRGLMPQSYVYSPPFRADGADVKGAQVNAAAIRPRIPWVLLYNYNSNGYKGVVADEDQPYFAISPRNLIQDDIILARYDSSNKAIAYSLEPTFLADTVDACLNIPWDYATGEMSIAVTKPDGDTVSLGKFPFVRQSGNGPTTGRSAFTAWVPPAYGHYQVKATGWIQDIWGNRYEGGGTYQFWIAKRMTLATATFQGMPYPVGSVYGRDLGLAPPVPADVTVTATLYPNSDPAQAVTASWGGKASAAGVYGSAQGAKNLPLSAPGEYAAHIVATYTDKDGHLWVSTMRHAGIVFDPQGPIVARGKKLLVNNQYVERGNTYDEGYIDTSTDAEHLIHLNFPYNSGDVLLIASDGQGADKIIPTLTYERKDRPQDRSDSQLNGIGNSNLVLKTSNGYSPHLFPEYITDWAYYYGAAPRPGFVSRFVVGEHAVRAPYWPLSPNSFGGQINASSNGDMVGDIYRLIGGVVLRQQGQQPQYAGYIASAFMLPQGSRNNRVIAPGSEELTGSTGQKARVFLVGPWPRMTYPVGTTFGAALQIDPIVPTDITFKLTYPDGRQVQTTGTSDIYGSFAGKDRWVMDIPGIYRYTIEASWNGYPAIMPGLPPGGGELYVIEAQPPPNAPGLEVKIADGTTFDPVQGIHIIGTTTSDKVHYAAVTPGAVLDGGDLIVSRGQFDYYFNPTELHNRASTYDVANRVSGKAELGDVVHLTFFSNEMSPDGQVYHSFLRLVIRGNQVRLAK